MTSASVDGAPAALPAVLRSYRYKPRTIAFQGSRAVGRWRVKSTVITVRGTARHFPEEIEAAWSQAGRLLAAVPDEGRDAGVASLVVHLGLAGVWLVLDWWQNGDGLMQRRFFASLDSPTDFDDVAGRHLGPGLWELAVQAHERDAWLRHVLANPSGPDLEAYLGDGLTGTV